MPSITTQTPAIEVSNLHKRYPKAATDAVDDVSFTVHRGEIFGLLGPNGAGKTTTIGILTTSVEPTSGTTTIMGVDRARDPIGVKQRISVVPQRMNLDQSLNVREILVFHAAYHGVPAAERAKRADALLAEFGLAERGKEKISYYSGGMTQRVMLARALMHTPDVLFLDEPTNNLDPQSRLFLWERIRTLHEQGTTILLTTHDMEEADRLCDRIAIMDAGRILVCDTPEALRRLIPGGTTLELRVQLPEYAATPAAQQQRSVQTSHLQDALRQLSGVSKVDEVAVPTQDSNTADVVVFRLYAEHAGALVAEAARILSEAHAELRDLHLAHSSLEDVFIYLTGRQLRV